MKTMLAVLGFVALGCGGPVDFPVALGLDPDFSDYEVCLIHEATARWEAATVARFDFRTTWDPMSQAQRPTFIYRDGQEDESDGGHCEQIGGGDIWIMAAGLPAYWTEPVQFANGFVTIVMHELGHHMGLDHLPPPAVMETPSGYPCVRTADLRAFEALYGGSYIEQSCEPVVSCAEFLP